MKAIKIQEQGNKVIAIAVVKYSELKNVVRFTNRESSDSNPYDQEYYESRNQEYYQRLVKSQRVNNIADFIENAYRQEKSGNETITSVFPSSMILAFDALNESDSIANSNYDDIIFPQSKDAVLIVDGQHRFAGMQLLEKRYLNKVQNNIFGEKEYSEILEWINDYRFNCTFLIDFDMWEQSQFFANVNFYQKRVNKSLYYDIFGSTPPDKRNDKNNSIYLSHSLVQYLNSSDKSPLKGMIKMLGTGDGLVSQAFVVEAIMNHFKTRGVWNFIEEDFKNNGNKHVMLTRIFVAYFTSIKNIFSDFWPIAGERYTSIMCKTTGLGALIRLLGLLYKELAIGSYPGMDPINFEKATLNELTDIFTQVFESIKDKGEVLFGTSSEFSGGGSSGFQAKLYKQLGEELNIF